MLATAFRSPATNPALTDSIPGSTFPALPLRFQPAASTIRSALRSATDSRFAPDRRPLRSRPVAASTTSLACRFPGLHSPSGPLDPSGSKRSAGSAASWSAIQNRPIPVRSPLPTSIASLRLRINVPEVGGQAVLGRQSAYATPWLTERHGYDPPFRIKAFCRIRCKLVRHPKPPDPRSLPAADFYC